MSFREAVFAARRGLAFASDRANAMSTIKRSVLHFEVSNKADVYMSYLAYKAFYTNFDLTFVILLIYS